MDCEFIGSKICVYEDDVVVHMLKIAGFLNVVIRGPNLEERYAISVDRMKETDLGIGPSGKKKAVVASEVVEARANELGLTLFHWDGFKSVFSRDFDLQDQSFSK